LLSSFSKYFYTNPFFVTSLEKRDKKFRLSGYGTMKKTNDKKILYAFLIFLLFYVFIFLSFQNVENAGQIITISAVGDMVFSSTIKDPSSTFIGVEDNLKADIQYGNLEGPITTYTKPAKDTTKSKMFAFKFPPITSQILKNAGFSAVLVANNHSFDYGTVGFKETLQYLTQAQIDAIGLKGDITYKNIKGKKVAIVGFHYSNRFNDINDLTSAANLAKKAREEADLVIAVFHGGKEGTDAAYVYNQVEYFGHEKRGNVYLFAHTLIDAGVDVVIGCGPHTLRGLELYKNKLIAYSLGNFLAAGGLSVKGSLSNSAILKISFSFSENGANIENAAVIPVSLVTKYPVLDNSGRVINFLRLLTEQIYRDNRKIKPDIAILDDGSINIMH
jgi:poly-gamma-glutamate capsule biosynthesis protein CapA/YwtB (metallophosphatase superfamily)